VTKYFKVPGRSKGLEFKEDALKKLRISIRYMAVILTKAAESFEMQAISWYYEVVDRPLPGDYRVTGDHAKRTGRT